jgi:TolB protein
VQVALVLLVLLLALVTSLLIVGSQRRTVPPIGPAGNGVIAYASDDGVTVVALDGSATTTRLRGLGIDSNAAFSPDGTQVAFLSRLPNATSAQGAARLYVAPLEGDEPARDIAGSLPVWNWDDPDVPPAWSPDGTQIAYTAFDLESNRIVIAITRVDGSGATTIVPDDDPLEYTHPQWSPDGRWLTFQAFTRGMIGHGTRLVLARSDGSDRRVLAESPTRSFSFSNVAWAPDGSQLAYHIDRGPTDEEYVVVRYDLKRDMETAVNPPGTRGIDPVWSPDGGWIAYREDSGPDTAWRVVVVDATAAGRTRRDLGPVIDCRMGWSPDGHYLIGYAVGCEGRLVVVDADDPSRVITLHAPGARGVVSWQRVPPEPGG